MKKNHGLLVVFLLIFTVPYFLLINKFLPNYIILACIAWLIYFIWTVRMNIKYYDASETDVF